MSPQTVRSINDGQFGTIVTNDEGRKMVRLDRGKQEVLVPYVAALWEPADRPALGPMQKARVCYEADRAFRIGRGEYGVSDWQSLKEPDRIKWLKPPGAADRAALYLAIQRALE